MGNDIFLTVADTTDALCVAHAVEYALTVKLPSPTAPTLAVADVVVTAELLPLILTPPDGVQINWPALAPTTVTAFVSVSEHTAKADVLIDEIVG